MQLPQSWVRWDTKISFGRKPSQSCVRCDSETAVVITPLQLKWRGTPRLSLWQPVPVLREVGLKDRRRDFLFSIVREVGLRDHRWNQLFHSKADRENFAESFTLKLFQLYLTLSSGITINVVAEPLFFVPLCYMLFHVIFINFKYHTCICSLIRGCEIVFSRVNDFICFSCTN